MLVRLFYGGCLLLVMLFAASVALWWMGTVLVVGGGALIGAWLKRAEVMDDAQARLFSSVRHTFAARAWGLCLEGYYQAIALLLQNLHTLRLLPPPRYHGTSIPVLVLPGYSENSGTMWWLARRLARAGFSPILIDFPSTLHLIEQNVEFLRLFIASLREQLGCDRIPVVAHSMGGLITRTLIHSHADHDVGLLVAVASPFRGTRLARLGARMGLRGHCLGQMVPDSEFLQRFPPSLPCGVPILSLIACQENIVVPEWSAVIDDAEVRVLDHPWGHTTPLFAREVYELIETWLNRQGVTRRNMDSIA